MTNDILNRPKAGNSRQFPMGASSQVALRVMTYNIRIEHEEDRQGPHDWSHRRTMVASLIAAYGVAIAGLQEANVSQWMDLRELLPNYTIEGFTAGFGGSQEENLLVCYQSTRVELLESAVFSLSATPNVPAIGWDAKYPRSCLYCKFRDKMTGQLLVFFNTHFDHKGQTARLESAELLVHLQKQLSQQEIARVVMGDFNPYFDRGGYQVYSTLVGTQLTDIRDVSQEGSSGPDGTWLGWEYEPTRSPDGEVGARLDHIFVGGPIEVIRAGVLTASADHHGNVLPNFDGLGVGNRDYPSDHLPVLADLIIGA